jgi:RNA polymerase-associated protein RTF1
MALSRRNEAEAERFRVKLKNCKAGHNRSQKIIRLQVWRLNRKNRADNFKNTSKLKPVNISLKAGESSGTKNLYD